MKSLFQNHNRKLACLLAFWIVGDNPVLAPTQIQLELDVTLRISTKLICLALNLELDLCLYKAFSLGIDKLELEFLVLLIGVLNKLTCFDG